MAAKKKDRVIAALVAALAAAIIAGTYFFLFRTTEPQIKVYFIQGDRLIAVRRQMEADKEPLEQAARALISGPNIEEKKKGVFSAVPGRARVLGVKRKGSLALVSFSQELEKYGGGGERTQKMVAQIVYTFTELPGVEKVQIKIGNRDKILLGGEGFVIDQPLTRADFSP